MICLYTTKLSLSLDYEMNINVYEAARADCPVYKRENMQKKICTLGNQVNK